MTVCGAQRTGNPDKDSLISYTDGRSLRPYLSEFDAVVHAAGAAHFREKGASEYRERMFAGNRDLTRDLVNAVRSAGGPRTFVHISSIAASGITRASDPVDETAEADPEKASAYALSKLAAEQEVLTLSGSGCTGVNLRPPLIYGSGAKGNWGFLQSIAEKGIPLPFKLVRNRRSLLSVENLADLVYRILIETASGGNSGTYNVADPGTVSLPEILDALSEGVEKPLRLIPVPVGLLELALRACGKKRVIDGMLGDLVLNTTKVETEFSWTPPVSTRMGIINSIRNS